MSYKHILVMTDFSVFSSKALEEAAFFAKSSGCPLTVLHVAYDRGQFQVYITDEQYTLIKQKIDSEIEEKFSRLESVCPPLKDVVWTSLIRRGIPYIEGLYEAEKGVYDLIVIGSHGESGLKKFAYGSTASKILSHSPVSVLVTKLN